MDAVIGFGWTKIMLYTVVKENYYFFFSIPGESKGCTINTKKILYSLSLSVIILFPQQSSLCYQAKTMSDNAMTPTIHNRHI